MHMLLTETVFHGLILLALGAGLTMVWRLLRAWETLESTLKLNWAHQSAPVATKS